MIIFRLMNFDYMLAITAVYCSQEVVNKNIDVILCNQLITVLLTILLKRK